MTTEIFYNLLYAWIALGIFTFFLLLRKTAPYGRHTSENWGPMIPNQWGWVLMEGFAPIFISYWFFTGDVIKTGASYFFYALYMGHYIYRSYIFPFRLKTTGKKMPLFIPGSALFFNLSNTFFIGYFLGYIGGNYASDYFYTPRFIAGLCIFIAGVFINVKSDNMLMLLRQPGDTGYKIPQGFLFEKISCPNLFGEIVEWFGYALMMGSLPAWSFAIWTFVNLVPRALDHHKWYRQKFSEYPPERKAVLPHVL